MSEVLWLSNDDVIKTGVCEIKRTVKIVEDTFRLFDAKKAVIAQESALRLQSGGEDQACYSLPAYVGGNADVCGVKWSAHGKPQGRDTGKSRIQAAIIINDKDSGVPLAVMNGTEIGAARTGAVTAAALARLAPFEAKKAALCGAGGQAEHQLQAILYGLPGVEEVAIWSRGCSKAEDLAARYEKQACARLYPVQTVDEAVDGADVVIGATSASSPYLTAKRLESSSLYCHIGFHEITWEAVSGFSYIVTDTWEEAKQVSGQSIFRYYRDGLMDESRLTGTLGAMISGRLALSRGTQSAKVLFDAFGLPIFDVRIAYEAYLRALELGLGRKMTW